MKVAIRQMTKADRQVWIEMRRALWPAHPEDHPPEVDDMLGRDDVWGFVAETSDGDALGFAEVALRPYANGCAGRPVPFLEGIWIKPGFRRQRVGAQLMAHIDGVLAARGFREIGSDAHIDNGPSHAAHRSWGFAETERVVYFRKLLTKF
jgi:aminoglycoside 6'-N-acetyltransferase I